jgi:DNA-binding NtrC family response regulator
VGIYDLSARFAGRHAIKNIKVLLVDDEVDFVKTLAQRLEMRDFLIATTHSGEEAVTFAKQKKPDVIVLDLKMPGIGGLEVLKRLKEHHQAAQVIILTAHGNDKDREEADKLDAYDFLKKPVDIETLVETIEAAYKKKCDMTI